MTIDTEFATLRWDDVREGDALDTLAFPITMRTLMIDVAGTRDLYPIHHDREFAKRNGARDIFVNTMFYEGLFGRIATDWAGREHALEGSFDSLLDLGSRGVAGLVKPKGVRYRDYDIRHGQDRWRDAQRSGPLEDCRFDQGPIGFCDRATAAP